MSIVNKILQEAYDQPESLFPEGDVNRYAFIWRDVSKFNTIEKKRAVVKKIEKIRKAGGKSLPVVSLDPMLFASNRTGTEETKENPVVVKLHGVYYAVDGFKQAYRAYSTAGDYIKCHLLDLDLEEVI